MAVEQLRVVLIIALCVVSFLLWDAWQRDYGPKPSPPTGTEPPSPDAGPTGDAISPSVDVPQAPQPAQTTAKTAPSLRADAGDTGGSRKIRVTTDVLAVEIDTLGGTIAGVDLRSYPVSNDRPDEPFRLLDDVDPKRFFIAQSGLTDRVRRRTTTRCSSSTRIPTNWPTARMLSTLRYVGARMTASR